MVPEFSATLDAVKTVALETKVFRFRVHAAEPNFTFIPGQFVSLRIQEKVFRAYSISSTPDELPYFETCVKILPGGVGSTYLDTLQPGETVTFRGAFGQFVVKNPAREKIFIATGTGISPIKSFLSEFVNKKYNGTHELIFGVRTRDYAPYAEEFAELRKNNPLFSFTLCLSQENPGLDPGQNLEFVKTGRVTDWAREQSPEHFLEKDIYICGSPPMVKEMLQILQEEKSVARGAIFTEAY